MTEEKKTIPTAAKMIVKQGPAPVLISRKQVDALYQILEAVRYALDALQIPYILTGGSLLGAVRQHSILFTDDDVDIAVIDQAYNDDSSRTSTSSWQRVRQGLQSMLGPEFMYTVSAWEGSDRVRLKRVSNAFLDLFCIRKYESMHDLRSVIGIKKNGQPQPEAYKQKILDTIHTSAASAAAVAPLFPCWHFVQRKAIELWPKEVYRDYELFPLQNTYKMGPLTALSGPHMPVTLLNRAFGDDCFQVYYNQSCSHHSGEAKKKNHNSSHDDDTTTTTNDGGGSFLPVVQAGGTWEGGVKFLLQQQHYLPMQPVSRSQRRPTLHGREQLLAYLHKQSELEAAVIDRQQRQFLAQSGIIAPAVAVPHCHFTTVYMDGVFDMFHVGHLSAIQQCAALGDRVIIGVTGDDDAANYKRPPIICEKDRVAIVAALRLVNQVICPCPLYVTQAFIQQHAIDVVVHGFANDEDAAKQQVFFQVPVQMGLFRRIHYYPDLSTTDIIRKIQALPRATNAEDKNIVNQDEIFVNQKWFGATVAAATSNAPSIAYDPFPLELRVVIEPHIRKATQRRAVAMAAVSRAAHISEKEILQLVQSSSPMATEGDFDFDTQRYPLRAALLKCASLSEDTDLTKLHNTHSGHGKVAMLQTLTRNFRDFQQVYDDFVLQVCAPHLAGDSSVTEIYYQSFPCIRMVQPGDFSIGPHSDIAYGHHVGSVNFYVPLTKIDGTAALFLESRLGSEDWHPIAGSYGTVKHFAGATCLHWTTENTAGITRVSLDFRLIAGPIFHALLPSKDSIYRHGFYSTCRLNQEQSIWERVEPALLLPDARVGFPWTVKDWDKYLEKQLQQNDVLTN
jgi:cytidyltransferase-like protein